jgi:uncharacterized membrane protein YraQ (UPF0718 family)
MFLKNNWPRLLLISGVFLGCYYLPVGGARFNGAVLEALQLVKWYAREHVILCLVPAFLIAGAISVFISQAAVIKYLGARTNKFLAYGVASVSGTILAVCSCTVLPLFAGIYRMGAGLGPATAFLYSGPAINVLAIVLTARILGPQLGIARAVGAVLFSVIIGLLMQLIFPAGKTGQSSPQVQLPEEEATHSLRQNAVYFASLVGILVFANLSSAPDQTGGWQTVFAHKWWLTAGSAAALGVILVAWFGLKWWAVLAASLPPIILAIIIPGSPSLVFGAGVIGLSIVLATAGEDSNAWLESSWDLAKQILPLLLLGVLAAGLFLGRPHSEGLIPSGWVEGAVGGNSISANLFASVAGAFMYFATLTEVPILEGLISSGMGKGPALALLLAGPAISLPNMLVIRSVMGTKKTVVFIILVVIMATVSGLIFGAFFSG